MKLFTSEHLFNYPWDQVTTANWQKYPNEISTHVVSVDVIRRDVNPETGILTSERLITIEQSIPNWISSLIGGKKLSYVREVSQVDMENKTLTMRSINLNMNHLLSVGETCTYSPDPENPIRSTLFRQTAEITAYASFKRVCDKIEDWCVERFGQNAVKGRAGFESVLKMMDLSWKEESQKDKHISGVLNEVAENIKAL